MSALSDLVPFYDVLLPGTHDSGTYGYRGNLDIYVRTQGPSNFADQLNKGIRFLDLRVRKVPGVPGENLNLYHGQDLSFDLGVTLDDALSAVQKFLEENPTESVVLSIKHEHVPDGLPQEEDITANDIQAYIDKYRINSSLPADSNSLWIAGPGDFNKIADDRRKSPNPKIAELNQTRPVVPSGLIPARNPWITGRPLNYHNLHMGDIRGKIVLYLRDMPGYRPFGSNGWAGSTMGALDDGVTSYGIDAQDNYDGPGYQEKKDAIFNHARNNSTNKYRINYTSAASSGANPASSPVSFALTINSGKPPYYLTDIEIEKAANYTPSLKTQLLGGDLYRWNIKEKFEGRSGLNGAMVGDFMTAPQEFYDDFWGNPFTNRRVVTDLSDGYPTSDHLTKAIWQQNALYVPKFTGADLDTLTGIPTFSEETPGKIGFSEFLDGASAYGVRYRISRIPGINHSLLQDSFAQAQEASTDDPFSLSLLAKNKKSKDAEVSVRRNKVLFDDEADSASGRLSDKGMLKFRVDEGLADPIGHRLFMLEFLANNSPIGAPYVFSIADSELLI